MANYGINIKKKNFFIFTYRRRQARGKDEIQFSTGSNTLTTFIIVY